MAAEELAALRMQLRDLQQAQTRRLAVEAQLNELEAGVRKLLGDENLPKAFFQGLSDKDRAVRAAMVTMEFPNPQPGVYLLTGQPERAFKTTLGFINPISLLPLKCVSQQLQRQIESSVETRAPMPVRMPYDLFTGTSPKTARRGEFLHKLATTFPRATKLLIQEPEFFIMSEEASKHFQYPKTTELRLTEKEGLYLITGILDNMHLTSLSLDLESNALSCICDKDRFPNLQSLSLKNRTTTFYESHFDFSMFKFLPNLIELSIDGVVRPGRCFESLKTLENLTSFHLSIRRQSADGILQMLNALPANLRCLVLTGTPGAAVATFEEVRKQPVSEPLIEALVNFRVLEALSVPFEVANGIWPDIVRRMPALQALTAPPWWEPQMITHTQLTQLRIFIPTEAQGNTILSHLGTAAPNVEHLVIGSWNFYTGKLPLELKCSKHDPPLTKVRALCLDRVALAPGFIRRYFPNIEELVQKVCENSEACLLCEVGDLENLLVYTIDLPELQHHPEEFICDERTDAECPTLRLIRIKTCFDMIMMRGALQRKCEEHVKRSAIDPEKICFMWHGNDPGLRLEFDNYEFLPHKERSYHVVAEKYFAGEFLLQRGLDYKALRRAYTQSPSRHP